MQFGFMEGKGITYAKWIVRQIPTDKMLERNIKLFCAFGDLETTFERVIREVTFWCPMKKGSQNK